jgi:putative oxidoreductase
MMRRDLPMILIRVIVGVVFVTEGILKFAYPDELGAGRFAGIGLPFPDLLGPLVGGVEVAGGVALLLNFYAGDAALALLVVIVSALITTKLPILVGRPIGPFTLMKAQHYGVMGFMHEARVDLCMLFGTVAVLVDSGLRLGHRRRWYESSTER